MNTIISNSHVQLIEKFIEFYNAFEVSKMVDLFSENCIFQNISNSNGQVECHGKEELFKMAMQSAKIFSERRQTVTNWIIGQDKIAVEIDYYAKLAIDLSNSLKKGDILNLKGISIYEFEGEKIKRLADFS